MRRLLLPGALAASLVLASCSGAVEVDPPSLTPAQRAACADFLRALPATLDDLEPVDVDPADAPAAAFGDPAVVVTCGVDRPEGYDAFSDCLEVDGVGWYLPQEAGDEPVEATLTTAGYRPRVEVVVPADYWPTGVATVTVQLAEAVSQTLRLVQPCR